MVMLLFAGCGDDGACLLDSDCALGSVCIAGRCQTRGVGTDASFDSSLPRLDAEVDAPLADTARDTTVTPPERQKAEIVATSPRFDDNGAHSASATFGIVTDRPECTRSTAGVCTVDRCTPAAIPDAGMPDAAMGDAGPPAIAHAGEISITGGDVDLSLTPEPSGVYVPVMDAGVLWSESPVVLSFSAAGADVPMFSGTVSAALPMAVATAPDSTGVFQIDRGTGFTLAWEPPANRMGDVVAYLDVDDGSGITVSVRCPFAVQDASGQVPSAAFGSIPPLSVAAFRVQIETVMEITAGSWDVALRTHTPALTADGNFVANSAMIMDEG